MGKSILNRHLILSSNKKKVSFHLISLKSYNYPQNKHPAPIRNPTLQNKKQFPIERLKILSNWATIKSEAPGTIRIALSFLFVNQALKESGSIALVLETKRTWGGEKLEGLREERTDDPGIVSKSFRGAFFLSFSPSPPLFPPLSKKKERSNGEKKHGEKERERGKVHHSRKFRKSIKKRGGGGWTSTTFCKLVDLRRWKNYGQRWTRVNEPGLFTALLSCLTDFETFQKAYIRTSRRKSSITKTPGFGEQFPRPSVYVTSPPLPFLPCHVHETTGYLEKKSFFCR